MNITYLKSLIVSSLCTDANSYNSYLYSFNIYNSYGVISLKYLAGDPAHTSPYLIYVPSYTSDPAATIPYIYAPYFIVDPIPINASSPILQPYKFEFGPIYELFPTVTGYVALT